MTSVLFSATTLSFYPRAFVEDGSYSNLPDDLVELNENEVSEFFKKSVPEGKALTSDGGRPRYKDVPPTPMSKDKVEELRLRAYSHPVYGSDRHFSESTALQAEGFAASSAEVKEAKAKGLARKLEIQTRYPWPVE